MPASLHIQKVRMSKPFVTACLASRGWGSYRTMASLLEELAPYPHTFAFAIGLPIPDAQNRCVELALADPRTDVLLWVEDDNLLGPGFLDAMLAMLSDEMPVVAVDYPLRNGPMCCIRHPVTGEVEATGFGCTVMRRSLFDHFPPAPFYAGTQHVLEASGWHDTGRPAWIGSFDTTFCRAVRALGYRIGVVPDLQAGHLQLVRGGGHVNHGMDVEQCFGGVGLPWRPIPREGSMAISYLKSQAGRVMDMDPDKGGNVQQWLDKGWVEISKHQFDTDLKAQIASEAVARAEWESEMGEDGLLEKAVELETQLAPRARGPRK